jgi:hypothetical protein
MGRSALLCLMLTGGGYAQENRPKDAAVDAFFPQRLIDESLQDFNRGGLRPFRVFGYTEIDLDRTGTKDYIVAGYSNGFSADVLVLRKTVGGSLTLVAGPQLKLTGSEPRVEARDVDGDGRQEVILELQDARGNWGMYILKWDALTLKSIEPRGQYDSLLVNADLIDTNGDGLLEAINAPAASFLNDQPTEVRAQIFSLSGGRYSGTPRYAFYKSRFRRLAGPPQTVTDEFFLNSPRPGFRIAGVNGAYGSPRIASGTIKLNGVEVVSQNQLNQQVGYLTVPVTVQQNNTIEVTLSGTPLGAILVLVLPPE